MTAITNYTTLVSALQKEAEDDGAEFLAFIPTAVSIVEDRLFSELDLPQLETKATGTTTVTNPQIAKPSGYKFAEYFMLDTGAGKRVLKKKKETFLHDYWPDESTTGVPKYYSDESSTYFRLAPTPNGTINYELKYTKKPTKLGSSNATNYYTDNCSDLLFYGCMQEMCRFQKAWSQLAVWDGEFKRAQGFWNLQASRYRIDGDMKVASSHNVPNTLKHASIDVNS